MRRQRNRDRRHNKRRRHIHNVRGRAKLNRIMSRRIVRHDLRGRGSRHSNRRVRSRIHHRRSNLLAIAVVVFVLVVVVVAFLAVVGFAVIIGAVIKRMLSRDPT